MLSGRACNRYCYMACGNVYSGAVFCTWFDCSAFCIGRDYSAFGKEKANGNLKSFSCRKMSALRRMERGINLLTFFHLSGIITADINCCSRYFE